MQNMNKGLQEVTLHMAQAANKKLYCQHCDILTFEHLPMQLCFLHTAFVYFRQDTLEISRCAE